MRWLVALAACLCAATAAPASAQGASVDGVSNLLTRLERVLLAADAGRLPLLFSPNAAPGLAGRIGSKAFVAGATRVVARERDRAALDGALPGDGYRLVVEVLIEAGPAARIVTLRLDTRRAPGDAAPEAWRIVNGQLLTLVDGLFRLDVTPSKQWTATNLTITAEDLSLTLIDGTVFTVDSERGTTALVLLGRGQMTFSPRPSIEQQQVRLFAGESPLAVPFDTALVKVNPVDFAARPPAGALTPVAVDARQLRRARDVFRDDAPKSFSLDLGDLSSDTWYLIPPPGDLVAEVRTRGRGVLTYARSIAEAEDVLLFERARGRDIARYSSVEKLAEIGRFYNDDELADYDVLDYDVDASVSPDREFIDARAHLRLRVRTPAMGTLNVKLADTLTVSSVTSPELGRLTHLRVRGRDTVVVNLPVALRRGSEVTFTFAYNGRAPSQSIDQEGLQFPDMAPPRGQRYYLLSSRAYWYPQPQTADYATAVIRVTVPDGFGCIASGEPAPGFRTAVSASGATIRVYAFRAPDRVRYLSVLVARFRTASTTEVSLVSESPGGTSMPPDVGGGAPVFPVRDTMTVSAEAPPFLEGRGREAGHRAGDILQFYASLMGDAPYPYLAVATLEHSQPGGHSPAYFVLLQTPAAGAPVTWRADPASFQGFQEFFIAHEVAHQWWGHALGWKNYHEQWISEGFAQYFAALYAEHRHGREPFEQMLRQFRRWALDMSDQGPIYLGYRLGQIKGDRQVFRALLYNKGAGVLHMLRRLIGDEAFFGGIRRLYAEHAYDKIGTDDVRRAFEAESGRPLSRFFDRWIHESDIPRLRVATTIENGEVVVLVKQRQTAVFDIPVTVTLTYADGRQEDVLVPVTEARVEQRIPSRGQVRSVRVNRDSAALAEFEE
ncbi:MAG: M1 family aminopeptidase [Vicinamibacterales bacterium]|nr:M1 family aminopeptidase [Vicinamibacterales bacterium]